MGGKTAAALGLEQMVAQDVLVGHVPVWRDLIGVDVLVGRGDVAAAGAAAEAEAVHGAAVEVAQEAVIAVTGIAVAAELDLLERDDLIAAGAAGAVVFAAQR